MNRRLTVDNDRLRVATLKRAVHVRKQLAGVLRSVRATDQAYDAAIGSTADLSKDDDTAVRLRKALLTG